MLNKRRCNDDCSCSRSSPAFRLDGTADADLVGYSCAEGADVTFRAADGTRLIGHIFGSGQTVVILGHQSQGSLCEWVAYARRLARLGYMAFAIDFRGHGLSQVRGGFPENASRATSTERKLMRKRGKQKVFLVGASMGGSRRSSPVRT